MHPQDIHTKCKKTLKFSNASYSYYHLAGLKKLGFAKIDRLPYSVRILLESVLRNLDGYAITEKDLRTIASWSPKSAGKKEIAFKPGRVVLQDFTGVPAIVDLAAMRGAIKKLGGDIKKINPQVRCDLVVDHSIQVDSFGSKASLKANMQKEFERNGERYQFLKWGQFAFENFSVVPPGAGIVHQVNLEYLARGFLVQKKGKENVIYPDSLIGTDSHTTMINGLSILGWGVGGIEAEAVMLGEPIYMLMPEVVGFELTGKIPKGVTATDLVLTLTNILRKKGVVGKFVEFYGAGLKHLSLPDRATIANMAPEYGATMGFFPFDNETLEYYKLTGRPASQIKLLEKYMKAQGLFYSTAGEKITYSSKVKFDLNGIEPCVAGPKRPQDKIRLSQVKKHFIADLTKPAAERGFGIDKTGLHFGDNGFEKINHGSVAIAAITSCTNTSNPSVLIAAGLLAKKAAARGLKVKPFVKTSFAPGSTVVREYLQKAKLLPHLEKLGFHIVGYGCTTCIGNSGPLPEHVSNEITQNNLVAAGVLSGNRNFEGRINPHVKANFLASPPLVVAYALAGNVRIDFDKDPLGTDQNGRNVYLRDIWPSGDEIKKIIKHSVTSEAFRRRYKNVERGTSEWQKIKVKKSELYRWSAQSTYIQEPPFFDTLSTKDRSIESIANARVLLKLGDSVTTDHISPAGAIAVDSAAGNYLIQQKVKRSDFNSYGARRGNDRIMTRGTFANIRLRNLLVPGTEGGITIHHPTGKRMSVYEAAMCYKKDQAPLIVIAGKEYGTGSSRDWAAKGTALLGVRAVIAESYERIHRSNLIGMGVLPLQFSPGMNPQKLGINGDEYFDIHINDDIKPGEEISIDIKPTETAKHKKSISVLARIDTPIEVDYYRNGGILQTVLLKLSQQ